jgi:RNA polymerase sigma-70 factor (ECF subfamily)
MKIGVVYLVRNVRSCIEKELLDNYEKYYRLAFSYVKNEADALDIVQESAYKAMKNSRKLKDSELADTWIYRIVVNTSLDFLRKAKKYSDAPYEEDVQNEIPYNETGYEKADVMELLSVLKPKDKTVIILRYFENLKLEQISTILGESPSTVKSRLYRAQEKLRVNMEG